MNDAKDLQHVHKALKKKFSNRKLIFGQGLLGSKIAIVCEMPGPNEESENKPLTGQNEKYVNQLLRLIGLDKKKVYITNVVKYHPKDKKPTPKEIKSYLPFLKEELKTVAPQVVVTLGDIALNGVGLRQPLDNVHGRTFNMGQYELLPTFHPEHAMKDQQIKSLLESDFLKLKTLLKKPPSTDSI